MSKEINNSNLGEEILKKPKAILDFWASWCHPCMQFKPIFDKVSEDYSDITFGKVNIEDYRDIAIEFSVMSIPTIIFFKDGKEVGRFTGSMPEESFKSKISKYLS